LAPNGIPARLVSDAVASLTALHANPGLSDTGFAALLDFGGGGTSITLADAASSFEPIETKRYTEFSGAHVDQLLMGHVLDGISAGSGATDAEGTAAVSSLEALRESCRAAKEQLSDDETATIPVDIPAHSDTVQISRAELDSLLTEPLQGVLDELDDLLQRNSIGWNDITSVVAVGGGARVPLVSQLLTEHVRAKRVGSAVVTTGQPALDAAVGAALFAVYGADADARTGMAPAVLLDGTQAMAVVDLGPDTGPATAPALADLDLPPDTAADRAVKAGGAALAWSQDDDATGEPLPYTGEDPYLDTATTRAVAKYVGPAGSVTAAPSKAWQRFPLAVFGIAAVAAIAAVGGVTVALTSSNNEAPAPAPPPVTSRPPAPVTTKAPPPSPPPPSTVTVTSEVLAPAPPPPPPPPPPPTHEAPVTVTHTAPPPAPHTTVTHAPTSTPPPVTTTEPPPPPPPSPVTTTSETPTMTTSYIRVPFVPVPIPIQVPKGPDQPSESQAPTNPYYPGQQQYPYQQYPQQQPYPQQLYPQQQYPQYQPQYPY
jgi:hypothetical protein